MYWTMYQLQIISLLRQSRYLALPLGGESLPRFHDPTHHRRRPRRDAQGQDPGLLKDTGISLLNAFLVVRLSMWPLACP